MLIVMFDVFTELRNKRQKKEAITWMYEEMTLQ